MLHLEELLSEFVPAKLKEYDRLRCEDNVRTLSKGDPIPDDFIGIFYKFTSMSFDYKEVKESYRECLHISIYSTRVRRYGRCVNDRWDDQIFRINITARDYENAFTQGERFLLRTLFYSEVSLYESDGKVFPELVARLKDYYIKRLKEEYGYTKDDINKLTR